ncbi:MAG: hypothetical protein AAF192_06700 [Pseudomonadota bacterium]
MPPNAIVDFPGGGRSGGGPSSTGGPFDPEDPTLTQRVARLEADVAELKVDVRDIRDRVGKIEERPACMEGGLEAINAKLDAKPSVRVLPTFFSANFFATAGLIVGLLNLMGRS